MSLPRVLRDPSPRPSLPVAQIAARAVAVAAAVWFAGEVIAWIIR